MKVTVGVRLALAGLVQVLLAGLLVVLPSSAWTQDALGVLAVVLTMLAIGLSLLALKIEVDRRAQQSEDKYHQLALDGYEATVQYATERWKIEADAFAAQSKLLQESFDREQELLDIIGKLNTDLKSSQMELAILRLLRDLAERNSRSDN